MDLWLKYKSYKVLECRSCTGTGSHVQGCMNKCVWHADGITSINNTRGSTEGSVVGGASNVTPLRVDSHPAQGSVTPQGLSSMQSGSQSNVRSCVFFVGI